jgi:archaellum component FlaC
LPAGEPSAAGQTAPADPAATAANAGQGGTGTGAAGGVTAESAAEPGVTASAPDSTAAAETVAEEAETGDRLAALMERLDGIENRIETLAQQGPGEDVRQTLDELRMRVEELAESAPGEELRQSVSELREEVQALAEQGPGEEVRAAIADLESRVQELAESGPGQEVQQAIASLEARVQELAQSQPGREMGEMLARMQEQIRDLTGGGATQGVQPVAPLVEPDAGIRGDTGAIGSVPAAEPPAVIGTVPSADEPATVGVDEAEPVEETPAVTGGTLPTDAATSEAGQSSGDEQAAVSGGSGDVTVFTASPQAGAQGTGIADVTRSAPCEEQIATIEEDLARAEEQGIAIGPAEEELVAARAMLRNGSQALCRAAIKRAHDELVAVGFEPTKLY